MTPHVAASVFCSVCHGRRNLIASPTIPHRARGWLLSGSSLHRPSGFADRIIPSLSSSKAAGSSADCQLDPSVHEAAWFIRQYTFAARDGSASRTLYHMVQRVCEWCRLGVPIFRRECLNKRSWLSTPSRPSQRISGQSMGRVGAAGHRAAHRDLSHLISSEVCDIC